MGLINKRTLLLGGLAVAAVAGALKNRERVAGLIGARTGGDAYEPPAGYTPPAPEPSNYDVAGPAANTATPVPAPEPVVRGEGGVDEAAEERAAAAEAAAIGGEPSSYAGPEPGEAATEEERPVVEAGGGESEGQEQTEAALADNAEPAAGDPIEGGRRIEETIERADQPAEGEQVETPSAERAASETPAEKKSSAVWAPSQQKDEDGDDDPGEWQTWSGRAVDK